jgi:predicted RNA binding protein YcfA (HicA-like mRNA interferase family)
VPRLPRVTGKEVIRALERDGFEIFRITGSHYHLHKWGEDHWGGIVTVPVHPGETIYPKLLRSILSQTHLTVERFIRLLR